MGNLARLRLGFDEYDVLSPVAPLSWTHGPLMLMKNIPNTVLAWNSSHDWKTALLSSDYEVFDEDWGRLDDMNDTLSRAQQLRKLQDGSNMFGACQIDMWDSRMHPDCKADWPTDRP